ncbi:hypothetical protein Patl1_03787 [Pistacia atlantica]|uniref:Uncharacterized protein n=1 Tax=Pistacia atlantica TaxID=434234 RepID=A0ACC1BQE0_9ROSI|nr:hypothetical protein Patl1_03787 [Pistacia atlantica]
MESYRLKSMQMVWDPSQLKGRSAEIKPESSRIKSEYSRAGGNYLEGELPTEIGNSTNSVWFGLAVANISGSLPSSIDPVLESEFNLWPIPRRIGKLSKLQELYLWQNSLVGAIPDDIGSCKELKSLDISENLLTGSIRRSFGKLVKLQRLKFQPVVRYNTC